MNTRYGYADTRYASAESIDCSDHGLAGVLRRLMGWESGIFMTLFVPTSGTGRGLGHRMKRAHPQSSRP